DAHALRDGTLTRLDEATSEHRSRSRTDADVEDQTRGRNETRDAHALRDATLASADEVPSEHGWRSRTDADARDQAANRNEKRSDRNSAGVAESHEARAANDSGEARSHNARDGRPHADPAASPLPGADSAMIPASDIRDPALRERLLARESAERSTPS